MSIHLGVDIGGTSVALGIVAEDGGILRRSSFPTKAPRPAESICDELADACRALAAEAGTTLGEIGGIGVGCPGIMSGGIVLEASNLGFHNVPLARMLSDRTGVSVLVQNDANAAAYGELVGGSGRGADSLVAITLGTGIGGGIVIRRRIYAGFNGQGAEIGHMVICPDGRLCACGHRGCFEAYCSASALIRDTREAMAVHLDSMMWNLCGNDLHNVCGRTAFDGLQAGDPVAKGVIESFIAHLATGVSNLVTLLQPEVLCIGGGLSAAGDMLLLPLRERLSTLSLPMPNNRTTQIVLAELGNDAGLIGAALMPGITQ